MMVQDAGFLEIRSEAMRILQGTRKVSDNGKVERRWVLERL